MGVVYVSVMCCNKIKPVGITEREMQSLSNQLIASFFCRCSAEVLAWEVKHSWAQSQKGRRPLML